MHVVIGTAGHIDHGKSALVRALTGTDPDRLKEEKERGMTTDLGFAFMGKDITIIDVPGHERFIRHMLAGASTIDIVMLVVAADDGVMPQTREHFEICQLLGIRRGIIVINKADLVDEEMINLVREDVLELVRDSFFETAPIVIVSAVTGQGIEKLREVIRSSVSELEPKPDRGIFRMPIDRCFTMKGFGTVVAGTVLSGQCRVGDRLELLPQSIEVRVRGIQQHNQPVDTARLGERAALNLQGIERTFLERGNVLATPGYYRPTTLVNASLLLLSNASRPLSNMTRVHLHTGTAEVMCRVVLLDARQLEPGESGFAQLRLESPIVCDWGDRFVIRSYSPPQTLGGGSILETNPARERRFDDALLRRLRALLNGGVVSVVEQYVLRSGFEARTAVQLAKDLALSADEIEKSCDQLLTAGKLERLKFEGRDYLVHSAKLAEARRLVVDALAKFHRDNPVRIGVKRSELRGKMGPCMSACVFEAALLREVAAGSVAVDGDRVRLTSHQVKLTPEEKAEFDRVDAMFAAAGLTPSSLTEALSGADKRLAERVRVALLESGRLVDCGDGVVLHRDTIAHVQQSLREMFSTKKELTASEIRQELGTTRKYVIPLLNYLDSIGFTQRRGEVRVLRVNR
ncbi:MAG: selenocysteine-specific translation elongation factor [candidate division WOR-3 bacterium]